MALHFQSLAELEVLCTHLYVGTDLTQRIEAEKALLELIDSPECLSKCQLLLEQGTTSYAQLLAATCLSKLVSRVSPLPVEQRVDIRNYILNYVASQPKLALFVIQALIQVIAKITKLGWFEVQKDQFVFREIIADVKKFLQGTVEHCIIGVIILSELTQEMNLVDYSRPSAKHRKIATSFRDTSLKDILVLACSLLKEVLAKPLNLQDQGQQNLVMQVLKLVLNCLNFDFIGSSADESADDLCTVQIPTTWRTILLEPETLDLFFNLYHSLPPLLSQLALSCLVQFASTRRSLFSSPERAKYLGNLIKGVKRILENPQGLSDPGNYHEFCRFLARLKTNYQLGELVMVKEYPEVIRLIANFTITSLQHWEFAPNSVHYLLTLWQRMVASVPFVKSTEPHLLDTYAPEITKAFITSRLESVAIVVRDNLDDPLDDTATVFQQLEQLCTVSRCEYEKTCTLLVQLFDQNAQNYQKLLHSPSAITVDKAIQEGRLAWLVYLVGTVVGGRLTYTSTDEHDAMDGELSCRVFQLISLMDTGLPQCSNEKIELAILWFLDQFRKTYVGDQLQRTSKVVRLKSDVSRVPEKAWKIVKVYARMSEVLGITDDNHVLETFMTKIVTNLKYWGRCEPVISRTLQFLNDLSVGYILLKKLVKIDAVKFMLKNHTSEHFPFLGISDSYSLSDFRCRTTFYTALTRLLMVDLGEDEDEFENFMLPLTVSFETILQIFNNNFKQEDVKRMLIGLARDLRGIAFALNTKTSYTMLFDWIYPTYLPILQRTIERWYGEPACTTPILKLMAELMQNRSQRLNFDVSSPNGILLFREASKMICTYGNQILSLGSLSKDQIYPMKLKGISICYSALKSALCGNYVSFGVFKLYGDNHFDNVLQAFVKMLLSVSHSDLLQYRKLSQSYYPLLECLTQDHMSFITNLDPPVLLYVLTSISEGLTTFDTVVSSSCCTSLDYIVTYLFKHIAKEGKKPLRCREATQAGQRLLHFMQQNPDVLQQMMSVLMNIIVFEDCRNQWSVSRPLLGLILLNEKYFSELRASLINSQPLPKQEVLAQCFRNLMEGVEQNLSIKNRDRFTQNLSVFRRDVAEALRNDGSSEPCSLDMMS
ncbi:ran-binding protein 17 isoform X1 [Canis lupus familiaris]|uniref:RAN binding protein 17 n=2 Tax=Canis lupus familiaris TaxID=9615 RepID=A0A8C0LSX0_CANLF|nr:ran-binding protein 17 isoform X1 [Canis lupus familiaris]XP_025290777.1 ran-binding protein 17 isoform X1 [Canis lupus dingo]XP_038390700.1 ran-binding protein 17 isoform X1 [Canis lupus familiaris]XP_038519305.1 ran-binding protein 17 isoform X1 [Canis lupus familiaris]|eukprot:XP_005619273.1 ran-binding protein 17 isoform X1 [Canis lupus familiaris]